MNTQPSVPSRDSVVVLQPLAQGYIPAARAVASALLYRYCGVNTGYGVEGATSTRDALRGMPTPMHTIQVVLAEWLQVYAFLESLNRPDDTRSVLSMTNVEKLPEPFEPINAPGDVLRLMRSGKHVPSLTAMLGFLADWVGTIMPTYVGLECGDTGKAVAPYIGNLTKVRVLHPHDSDALSKLYAKATELPNTLFLKYVNAILTREKGMHGTALLIGSGSIDAETLPLRKLYSKSKTIVPAPMDVGTSMNVRVPKTFSFGSSDDDFVRTAQGTTLLVVHARALGAWFPVFACSTEDAVLQQVVISAMADTFVEAITVSAPGPAELREIINKTSLLNFAMSRDAIERSVREAFRRKFGSFGSKATAASSSSSSSSALLPLYFSPEAFDDIRRLLPSLHAKAQLWWSILLTREDLLAIFVSTADEPREALLKLWNEYHHSGKSTLVNDADSDACVHAVTVDSDSIANAYSWPVGKVLVEIVFSPADLTAVLGIVETLQSSVNAFVVVTAPDRTYVSYDDIIDEKCTVLASIRRLDGTNDLELMQSTNKRRVHTADMVACSQAPLRGLLLQASHVVPSTEGVLRDVLAAVDPDSISSTELRTTVEHSIAKLGKTGF